MGKALVCDVCKKTTQKIVFKMYLSLKTGVNGANPDRWPSTTQDHSNYIAHADVGQCCAAKMQEEIRWTKRKKQQKKKEEKAA